MKYIILPVSEMNSFQLVTLVQSWTRLRLDLKFLQSGRESRIRTIMMLIIILRHSSDVRESLY